MSLPVPLSPCKSTGTDVSAIFSSFSFACRIAAVNPKITGRGGKAHLSASSFLRVHAIDEGTLPLALTSDLQLAGHPRWIINKSRYFGFYACFARICEIHH